MKKIRFLGVLLAVILCFCLSGCAEATVDNLNSEIVRLEDKIESLKGDIQELEGQKASLSKDIENIKVENGTAKYIVTFNIKQSHTALDFENYIKDELNDISIQIPVDKEYYDSVAVGDTIDDSFRMGSLLLKGSFGRWNITVENKSIQ